MVVLVNVASDGVAVATFDGIKSPLDGGIVFPWIFGYQQNTEPMFGSTRINSLSIQELYNRQA
jgi:hypothetical protein